MRKSLLAAAVAGLVAGAVHLIQYMPTAAGWVPVLKQNGVIPQDTPPAEMLAAGSVLVFSALMGGVGKLRRRKVAEPFKAQLVEVQDDPGLSIVKRRAKVNQLRGEILAGEQELAARANRIAKLAPLVEADELKLLELEEAANKAADAFEAWRMNESRRSRLMELEANQAEHKALVESLTKLRDELS